MCLEFPGRIVALDRDGATVETQGRLRRASTLLFDDLAVGDWVVVAAGTVFRRLSAAEAVELTDAISQAVGEK